MRNSSVYEIGRMLRNRTCACETRHTLTKQDERFVRKEALLRRECVGCSERKRERFSEKEKKG